MVNLIVNADDAGYCGERDDGIIRTIEEGIVRNVSLLVNGKTATSFVEKVKEKQLDVFISLHLNLTEFFPISNKENNTLVSKKSGQLRGKFGFRKALKNSKIKQEDIKEEVRAQIERFKQITSYYPLNIDGHQHIHVITDIVRVLGELFSEYRVKSTRIAVELIEENKCNLSPFLQNVSKESELAKQIYFDEFNIGSTDYFMGLSLMGNSSFSSLLPYFQLLSNIYSSLNQINDNDQLDNTNLEESNLDESRNQTKVVTIEWMCHPGYVCTCDHGDDFAKDIARKLEGDLLVDISLQNYLNTSKQSFTITNFHCIPHF